MAQDNIFSNKTRNTNAQCKVVVYAWNQVLNQPDIPDVELAKTHRLDISSQVQSVSFTKNMGNAAGTFNIELTNSPGIGTQDWKDIIKRGYWVVIYMTQDGDLQMTNGVAPAKVNVSEQHRIRGICYVERAGVKGAVGEKGDIDMSFQISGRDFGIIYEETSIWHNLFKFDAIVLESIKTNQLNIIGNVRINEAINLIHDLFYYPANIPGIKPNDDGSLLSIGLQWLMPKQMMKDIGFSLTALNNSTYWGSLPGIKNFSATECGISVEHPADFLSGNAWEQLKKLSIPQLHELFCETNDAGTPQLTFRPIPWAMNKTAYPVVGAKISYYKDVTAITIPAIDLIEFDLAEDDHARYNHFLTTVSTTLINTNDNISLLDGSRFPFQNHASIRRHGFRPMHAAVDSIVKNEELADGQANKRVLIEFNEVMFDYWNNSVFGESGSIQKIGSNRVKIGKCVLFKDDVPYLNTKRYYIEGYTDTFTVGDKGEVSWIQEVALTRGFETSALLNDSGFSNRQVEFSNPGEFTPGGSQGSGS